MIDHLEIAIMVYFGIGAFSTIVLWLDTQAEINTYFGLTVMLIVFLFWPLVVPIVAVFSLIDMVRRKVRK